MATQYDVTIESPLMPNDTIKDLRRACKWNATALAAELGISRQTVHAIEAGQYVPNTTIALRLAELLGTTVEHLFGGGRAAASQRTSATLLASGRNPAPGAPVQAWKLGDQWFAARAPRYPSYLPVADRVIGAPRGQKVSIEVHAPPANSQLVIAGCDPALSLLATTLSARGVNTLLLPVPSRVALNWLKDGRVHMAGTHLRDPKTGEYNLPFVNRLFSGDARVLTFASWEEGLLVPRRNPKRIRGIKDLRRGIRIVNRESGSGARDVLDSGLIAAGLSPRQIAGYDTVVESHFAAAATVAAGGADCCVATSAVAEWFGLGFLPLQVERFDLVARPAALDERWMGAVSETLCAGAFRRRLSALAGYDTKRTGHTVRNT